MKRYARVLALTAVSLLTGCEDEKKTDVIRFATCGDYSPFEYYENGELTGFDIELAKLVAQKLGKKAEFKDMQFAAILASLQSESADAAISAMAASEERKKNYDFSDEYYAESFAIVYKKSKPVTEQKQLADLKIVCQLGSTMEMWLKKHFPNASVIKVDNNNQAIESLKADHAECVFIDEVQGAAFCEKNDGLAYSFIAKSEDGYAIATKKGSPLTQQINDALKELKDEIKALEKKWIRKKWKN